MTVSAVLREFNQFMVGGKLGWKDGVKVERSGHTRANHHWDFTVPHSWTTDIADSIDGKDEAGELVNLAQGNAFMTILARQVHATTCHSEPVYILAQDAISPMSAKRTPA
eukprot:6161743-Amphidinium_carterae.1